MKVDDNKVLTTAYLITDSLNRKELMKLILLLIGYLYDKNVKAH
jgi:hypothetical protein